MNRVLLCEKGQRPNIGFFLSIIGILIWVVFIIQYRIWWVGPEHHFGLFQALPLYFWLGVAFHLSGILFSMNRRSDYLFLLQIIFLNLMIWGTPVFIEPNARILDSWQWMGTTKTIIESGHIQFNSDPTHFYLQWPGSFVFNSMLLELTSIDPLIFLQIYPLISSTLFILTYYVMIKKLVSSVIIQRYTILLIILLNLWLQFHFSPQAFALMFLPLFILSINKSGIKWILVSILFIIALIISHPTSTVFLLAIIFCQLSISIFLQLKRNDEKSEKHRKHLKVNFMILTSILLIIISMLYIGSNNFERLLDFNKFYDTMISVISSRVQSLPSITRMIILSIMLIPVISAILIYRKNEKNMFIFSLGWILGCTIPLFWDFTMGGGGHHDRVLMFAFILIPLLLTTYIWSINNEKQRNMVLAIILLLAIVGTFTLYTNENGVIVSDSNLATAQFIMENDNGREVFSVNLRSIYVTDTEINHKGYIHYTSTPGQYIESDSMVIFDNYSMSLSTSSSIYITESIDYYGYGDTHKIYNNNKFTVYLTKERMGE